MDTWPRRVRVVGTAASWITTVETVREVLTPTEAQPAGAEAAVTAVGVVPEVVAEVEDEETQEVNKDGNPITGPAAP